MDSLPTSYLPMMTWPHFYYPQQVDYITSDAWQTWLIGGNGTGKSLLVYNSLALQLHGLHPKQVGIVPIKVKVLVPSFDIRVKFPRDSFSIACRNIIGSASL